MTGFRSNTSPTMPIYNYRIGVEWQIFTELKPDYIANSSLMLHALQSSE